MRRYLAGIEGYGLVSLAAISVLIVFVMLTACWAPARRAAIRLRRYAVSDTARINPALIPESRH